MSRQNLPKPAPSNAARIIRWFSFIAVAIIIGTIVTVILLPARSNTLSDAQMAYMAGDYQAAIQAFSAAIGQDPNDAEAFLGRGLTYIQTGNLEGARSDFLQANLLLPNDTRPLYQLGLLAINNAQYPSAIDYFTDALALNENYTLAYAGRAYAFAQNGDYLLAIADYNAAIALDDTKGEYYRGLGDAHFAIDNTEQALAAYQRYVELSEEVDGNVLQRIYELQNR
jgi:tetratricopeptide (TPR) repeat protein